MSLMLDPDNPQKEILKTLKSEQDKHCSRCEHHRSKSNPTTGKLIPNHHGKCTRPEGLCEEIASIQDTAPAIPAEREAELMEVQDQASTAIQAVLDAEPLQEALGVIKTATFYQKISDVLIAQAFQEIKKSKSYKNYPYVDADGKRRQIADLEEFCQVKFGKSARRVRELSKNLHLLGPDLYEQAEQIGFKSRDYRALNALPADEQAIVKEAMEADSKEQVFDILQDMAARHQAEKEAAKKEAEDLKADMDAKDKVLADKAERLESSEMELAKLRSLPKDADTELRLEVEAEAVKVLNELHVTVLAEMNQFLAHTDAMTTTPNISSHTMIYATQIAEALCQDIGAAMAEHGIPVDFENIVSPVWMRETAQADHAIGNASTSFGEQ